MSRKSPRGGAGKAAPQTLTLLTATGARPEAWAICEKLMAAQDFAGPVRWVIVDDGPQPQPLAFQRPAWTLEVLRPEPFWQPGQNTQARNLAAGLARIDDAQRVVIIEDDDYYASDYLSAVAGWLDAAELVGEGGARYYNVASRLWHDFGTASPHASLCSTAVRGPALATLRKVLAADTQFIDMRLWRDFRGRKALHPPARVVGIKGMPGRGGIGVGHRMNGQPDPQGEKLAEWLGDAAVLYPRPAAGPPGAEGFARQFTDWAVGSMPSPRAGTVLRPVGFIGRDRAHHIPAVHVFGSGLATAQRHPFVVASIYADTPQDAAHAAALGKALESLGIAFFLAKAEGQSSWTGDGTLKASYLHSRWKDSQLPVAWLDIDTPPQSLPGWFASLDADFAVHNRSWATGLQAGALEFSPRALWFARGPLAGELLALWEQRCQADPATPEATHLSAAWFDISSRLPLRTAWLPDPTAAADAAAAVPLPGLVQLLTPTGCRPQTFALCARWMARQTWRGAVRWIIVDDGEVPQPLPAMPANWELVVIRPQPFWREGDRTQPRNFLAGLDAAQPDAPVIVIEDDDWYAPDYLEVTMQRLASHSMVAVGPQRWSNVKLGTCGEYTALQWPWSSQLAFRAEAIAHVRHITATRQSYIDRDTWNEYPGSKQMFRDGRVVGIKGLPGRGGYMSVHHRAEGHADPGLQQLQQWIGADAEVYRAVPSADATANSIHAGPAALIQVLTTTGCRPEAMRLCARWMARQTYTGRVRWIIVDDGEQPQPLPDMPANWELAVIRPQPYWREGDRTQPRNFVAGLDAALPAPVIVVEDDDWYAPDYLEVMAQRLATHAMVAAGPIRWMNLPLRTYWEHVQPWPMMSQMAFGPEAFAHARRIAASQQHMLDRDIWQGWSGTKQLYEDGRSIALKGLPGRSGYMNAHRQIMGRTDPQFQRLRQWIGDDAEVYAQMNGNPWSPAQAAFVAQFSHHAVGVVPKSDPPSADEEALQLMGYMGGDREAGSRGMHVFGTGLANPASHPFIIASIHGDNPQDCAQALALGQALEQMKIRFFIAKDEGNAAWKTSGGLKASFIRDLWKDSDAPVAWLDSQTAIRAFPAWFGAMDADFAIHSRIGKGGANGAMAIFVPTAIWFGKSPLAGELLSEWVRRCAAEPDTSDDAHLATVWREVNARQPLRTIWLPESYAAKMAAPMDGAAPSAATPANRIATMQQLAVGLVAGKHGLEIGGPSRRFTSRDMLPVYPVVASCDCTNFQAETLWERGLGKDFAPEGRRLGERISSEMTELKFADAAYDFILSSHALEHSANPLKALKESFRVLKPGGSMILILPERAATFDHKRPITPFEHLLDDERHNVGEDDLTHYEEIMALHDLERDKPAGTIEQFRARSLKNLDNRGLHQHVFDPELARKATEYSGFEVLEVGHMSRMDIVVIARKPEARREPAPEELPARRKSSRNRAGSFRTVEALLQELQRLRGAGDLENALAVLQRFVTACFADQRSTGKVFADRRLDQICQQLGADRLAQIGEVATGTPHDGVDCAVLATELYDRGGHTGVLGDVIDTGKLGTRIAVLLTSDANGSGAAVVRERLGEAATLEVAPNGPLLAKLDWTFQRLAALRPRRLLLMNHHHDAVAIAAAQPSVATETLFLHHADNKLCLGVTLPHAVHVDPHPNGFWNCRNHVGHQANIYWPMSARDLGARKDAAWMADGHLRTCSSGNDAKFLTPYKYSYVELIPQIIQRTGGTHVHNGPLPTSALNTIRKGLAALGIAEERFVHVPWVRSVWEMLLARQIDVVLGSFPIAGGRLVIEAMGAGVPVIGHESHRSSFFDGIDVYYPEAFLWREPAALLEHLDGLTAPRLASESLQARAHYEKFHTPAVLARAVARRDVPAPPLRAHFTDPLQSLMDEWNS